MHGLAAALGRWRRAIEKLEKLALEDERERVQAWAQGSGVGGDVPPQECYATSQRLNTEATIAAMTQSLALTPCAGTQTPFQRVPTTGH